MPLENVGSGAEILSRLDDTTETEENPSTATVTEAPNKPVTLEAVRAILAEKARTGFRAEVKALLTEYGADKLSDITDPDKLATLMEKAGVIGGA